MVQVEDDLELVRTLLLRQDKLSDEPILSNHDALFVDDVIELSIIFLQDVVFVVFLIFVVLQILITIGPTIVALYVIAIITFTIFPLEHIRLALTLFLSMLVIKLLEDVLDLPLELVIDLVHEVLQHLRHAKLLRLLP